jgi:hypothetical protein
MFGKQKILAELLGWSLVTRCYNHDCFIVTLIIHLLCKKIKNIDAKFDRLSLKLHISSKVFHLEVKTK